MANVIEESFNIFNSSISKELFTQLSKANPDYTQKHMFTNSLINSEENSGEYVSEVTNPLFDESDQIVPLTSDIRLFSHYSNN